MIKSKYVGRKIPNPDSDMVSHIHVIVIAPQTSKKVVTITCLNLQKQQITRQKYQVIKQKEFRQRVVPPYLWFNKSMISMQKKMRSISL
jgi:predicted nuclease of predicted toxin-antitoxin system